MKDVIITVKGLMGTDARGDDIELVTAGTYTYGEECSTCEYLESELTGMDGTRTTITADANGVTVTREGSVNMQMVFREGEKHYCLYKTPFGAMSFDIDTQSVLTKLGEKGGRMEIKYALDIMQSGANRNTVLVDIREA